MFHYNLLHFHPQLQNSNANLTSNPKRGNILLHHNLHRVNPPIPTPTRDPKNPKISKPNRQNKQRPKKHPNLIRHNKRNKRASGG